MTAKNPKARHRRFLEAGFFPPELPPCFYSEQLARSRDALAAAFSTVPLKNKDPAYYYYKSHKTTFGFPRFRTADRQHAFINPISYFFISQLLADNYVNLRSKCRTSRLSISPSVFDWTGQRALKRPTFDVRDRFLSDARAQFENIVHADIRSFYHSIYTHSIPWAIHGKTNAKRNRSTMLVGNLLDLLVRNSQDGQTIGLPVGPDTSRFVAEIIGHAIDAEVQKKLKKLKGRGTRFVDDFAIGCNTRAEAERAIAIIRRAVNVYELDLNSQKTLIDGGPRVPPGGWKALVRSFIPRGQVTNEAMEIFFFRAAELAEQMPEVNIEKFALQNSRRTLAECPNWKTTENYLLSLYKANPTTIDTIVDVFIGRHNAKGDVSVDIATAFIDARLPVLCDQRRFGEAAWLLFMAVAMKLKLKAKSLQPFTEEAEPLSALMISDAVSRQLVDGSVNLGKWQKYLTSDDLDGEMWLYAYEATLKKITGSNTGDAFIAKHTWFSQLYSRRIEFYRSGQGVLTLDATLHRRKQENVASKKVTANLASIFDDTVDIIDDLEFEDDEDVY